MIEIVTRWLKQLFRLHPSGGCFGCKQVFWSYGAWERHLKEIHADKMEIR